jgi:hypothetical protein
MTDPKRILSRAKKAPKAGDKIRLHMLASEEKTIKLGPETVHEVKRDE